MRWEFEFSLESEGPYEQLGSRSGMTWQGAARNLVVAQGQRLREGYYRIRLVDDPGLWATARWDDREGFEFVDAQEPETLVGKTASTPSRSRTES